ncbi:dihydrolipoyllysine-residue acetyltransferase [Carnimonas bestiolae]|uniref:dihydrolipoyllysine-residue acetyltransferase n=1 Tax=Carnimonas bestiolae TaxID=3402172 RepID=UPI003EDBE11F
MSSEIIKVPDIGSDEAVEIIEVSVEAGDEVSAEDTIITLESDKASMDIPVPKGGKVKRVLVAEGDKVSTGDDILELETEADGDAADAQQDDAPAAAAEAQPDTVAEPEAAQPEASQPSQTGSGSSEIEIRLPDIGEDAVEIIEVAVKAGDQVEAEDTLITLESDKASMDIPSPDSGEVVELTVAEGDKVSTGDVIGRLKVAGGQAAADAAPQQSAAASQAAAETSADNAEPAEAKPASQPAEQPSGEPQRKELRVPDIGSDGAVPVIEVAVSVGDDIAAEDTLLTLESDKASMDVPSPYAGKVVEVSISEGDELKQGDLIGYVEVAGAAAPAAEEAPKAQESSAVEQAEPSSQAAPVAPSAPQSPQAAVREGHEPSTEALSEEQRNQRPSVHAGPAARLMARELGVELTDVTPSGPRGRVLKEDIQQHVKQVMSQKGSAAAQPAAAAPAASGAGIPPIPAVDFSAFGEVEEKPMGRLLKAGATNLHRSWLNVPHVTQFDEADITELEEFRKSVKEEAFREGAKLTPVPFMIKAVAHALHKFPQFNVSLHPDGDKIIWKKYVHIGIAVDTPDGLMVPVLRDADKKSIIQIALEFADLAKRAQQKKLKREEMQGGCFTISSLGSIGGTAFTPIVNAPEVAILGLSRSELKPKWDGKEFKPRLMLPLSLSYDHRAVNGADAARFTAYLAKVLADIRRLTL